MPTDPKPRRRWFRFSLRTLIVVVMLIGAWIGWVMRTVHQREAFAKYIVAHGGSVTDWKMMGPRPPWKKNTLPWAWSILGATAIGSINLERESGFTRADVVELAKWFPEAEVIYTHRNQVEDYLSNGEAGNFK